MRRRQFIALLASAVLAWPPTARAQQPAVARRIAILSDFSELEMQPLIATFREQLQQLGWGDDSIRIDTRLGITGAAQFQGAAAALVGMAPDVIVTLGSPSLRAMKQETRTIPIVFTFVADPVGQGLVASLAHPGGNATGFTNFEFSFAGKWLDALKEIEPHISNVTVIVNPGNTWRCWTFTILGGARSNLWCEGGSWARANSCGNRKHNRGLRQCPGSRFDRCA